MTRLSYLVVESDPDRARLKYIAFHPTLEAARADATARNRRLLAAEGPPRSAPFRYFFAIHRSGADRGGCGFYVREDGDG